jgi:hypothetical protein
MPQLQTLPTWLALNAANFTSPTGLTDLRTGNPQYGGALNVGDYFDLTEAEANQLSYTTTGTLHAGRYRFVQVDSAATAANVKTGTVGLQLSLANGPNVITSLDKGLSGGATPVTSGKARAVVFLNAIAPGGYGFVQEQGDANVLFGATASGGAGTPVFAAATGVGSSSATNGLILGGAEATLSISVLNRVLLDLPLIQG